jgi:hypothetical protein
LVATGVFGRFGFVVANANQGREDPANTVPVMTAQTREEKTEEGIDARQLVRGAFTDEVDEYLRTQV